MTSTVWYVTTGQPPFHKQINYFGFFSLFTQRGKTLHFVCRSFNFAEAPNNGAPHPKAEQSTFILFFFFIDLKNGPVIIPLAEALPEWRKKDAPFPQNLQA
jgi:hypothetical protein